MFLNIIAYTYFSLLVTALPLQPNLEDEKPPKYFKIEAKKFRGTNFNDAQVGGEAHLLVKRDESGSGYISLGLKNKNTFYLADLEFGSNNQTIGVLVDTGSSDLWVLNSNNTYCESGTGSSSSSSSKKGRALNDIYDFSSNSDFESNSKAGNSEEKNDALEIKNNTTSSIEGLHNKASSSSSSSSSDLIDCSDFGTFSPSDSDTFTSNGTSFAITYADSTFAKGTWGHDDVSFSGITVDNLSFAVCDDSDNNMGVLGIGLAGLETTYSGSTSSGFGSTRPYQYENLPLRLKSQGIIDHVAYSVYLNDTSAKTANILFGAVDHSKYTGDLVELPIVNILESKRYNTAIQLDVTLNSITLVDNNSSQGATIGSGAASALLDTGTTLTYVPSGVLSSIIDALNATYSSSLGYYVMQCSAAEGYSISFNFQGFEIDVELASFMVSLVTTGGSTSNYCLLGLQSSETSAFTLGDSFLRNVYMVADLENLSIGLAKANYDGSAEDIEVISSSIPSAVQPLSTGATWGASATALNVVSVVSMSEIPSTSNGSTTSRTASVENENTSIISDTAAVTGSATSGTTSTSSSPRTVSSISSTNSRNGSDRTLLIGGLMGNVLAFLAVLF